MSCGQFHARQALGRGEIKRELFWCTTRRSAIRESSAHAWCSILLGPMRYGGHGCFEVWRMSSAVGTVNVSPLVSVPHPSRRSTESVTHRSASSTTRLSEEKETSDAVSTIPEDVGSIKSASSSRDDCHCWPSCRSERVRARGRGHEHDGTNADYADSSGAASRLLV